MKSLYALCLFLLIGFGAKAQPISNAPEQDCINGIPVCASGYSQVNSYEGFGAIEELNGTNQGCLGSGEKNDVWYIITVSSTGIFNLNITPNDLTEDYDFALWDITNGGCQAIYDGAGPIGSPAGPPFSACNYSPTRGVTGLNSANVAAGLSQWSNSINVTAGQVLALNVSNFENDSLDGYTLDFNGSTAQFVDTVKPFYKGTVVRCGTVADSVDVVFSEPITCASIAADGSNFSLSPLPPGIQVISARGLSCVGLSKYSKEVRLKFSGTLPAGTYTLSGEKGTNSSYLQDACDNNQDSVGTNPVAKITINFTMYPPGPPVIDSSGKPACSHITVKFNREVKCKTIAPDGSDFFIVGPSPVAITHADVSRCSPDGLIKIVDLHFDKSIETPGAYVINFKTGTDGDGIEDTCNATVVKPYRFDVADTGATATATPEILCNPGYATLTATVENPPYGALVRCGTGGGPDLIGAVSVRDTIGTFADTTDGVTSPTFFDGSQANVRTQILYSAAELRAAGLSAGRFKSVSFFVGDKQSFLPFRDLNIKMGCISGNFGAFRAGLPIVYSTPAYTTQKGENKFNLTNAYDWDGQSDIVVEICYSNPVVTLSNYDQLVYTTKPGAVYRRASNALSVPGCAFDDNSGTGGYFDARPTLAFTFQKPPVQDYHWLWLPSNYVEDSTSPTTLAYVPEGPRQYVIQAKDQYGCYRRDTTVVDISIRNPYGYPANDTTICIGGTAQLLVGNGVRYEWFPAEGLSCTDCPNPTVSPTKTTTYYAAIFDPYGCSDTLSATVLVNALPIVNAGPDTSVLYGYGVPLYALVPGARYYAWTPTDGLNYANVANPIASPLQTTEYVLQVIDTNYCIAYDSVTVRVRRDVPVAIPNAFTPNGDSRNDVFQVVNLGINKLVEMRIFNRWGTMVCNTTDNTRGWDGTYRGEPQDAGVYKYLIRIVKPDGTSQEFKGDLNLLR